MTRPLLTIGFATAAFFVATVHAQSQQWCAYSTVRDTQLRCGYLSEQACIKAAKQQQEACTLDPFYD
jgi:hypothetical protein